MNSLNQLSTQRMRRFHRKNASGVIRSSQGYDGNKDESSNRTFRENDLPRAHDAPVDSFSEGDGTNFPFPRHRNSIHTRSKNADHKSINLANKLISSSMMCLPFDLFEVGSQCSAEVVHPNMPLRGWITSLVRRLKCNVLSGSYSAWLRS